MSFSELTENLRQESPRSYHVAGPSRIHFFRRKEITSLIDCSRGFVRRPIRVREFARIRLEVSRSGARNLLHPPVDGRAA